MPRFWAGAAELDCREPTIAHADKLEYIPDFIGIGVAIDGFRARQGRQA